MELLPEDLLKLGISANDLPRNLHPGSDLTSLVRNGDVACETDLQQKVAGGAALTFGVPWLSAELNVEWFGRRFFYWNSGLPARLIGIAMSRVGRTTEEQKPLFDAIRTAIVGMDAAREFVLVSCGTSAERYVSRAATLFGRSALCVSTEFADQPWEKFNWLFGKEVPVQPQESGVFVSPVLGEPSTSKLGSKSDLQSAPLRDRLLIGLAHRVLCAFVRGRGHTYRLMNERLASSGWSAGTTLIRQVHNKAAQELIERGGIEWLVLDDVASASHSQIEETDRGANSVPNTEAYSRIPHDEFLTHCTRRYDGPWPGETEAQFLDDLLLDRTGADHSALATLCRIVAQRKLLGSCETTRGEQPVVCLSECSAAELVGRRTFRAHKGKWDYEPYGLCIRRDWLVSLGVTRVTYIPKSDWPGVAADDVWHHQTESLADKSVSWSEEREWRSRGDIDLTSVPVECVFVFVPDVQSAEVVRSVSLWPVVVLGDAI